jgi:hypothetical protein
MTGNIIRVGLKSREESRDFELRESRDKNLEPRDKKQDLD